MSSLNVVKHPQNTAMTMVLAERIIVTQTADRAGLIVFWSGECITTAIVMIKIYVMANIHPWQNEILNLVSGVINSLSSGRRGCVDVYFIFKHTSLIDSFNNFSRIILSWMLEWFIGDYLTLGWVTRHYLRQCWLRPMSPYGVTRPKWMS